MGGSVLPIPIPLFHETGISPVGAVATIFVSFIVLNVILNLFNLVPIFPLDGGQVARQLMIKMDASGGLRNSLYLSLVACVLMVLFSLSMKASFMAFFFGFMAWSNYQSLQGFGNRW